MPLARSLAHRYAGRREPMDDLVQVASMGLIKAIDGFAPERGRPFTAYAVPTILGELRRHFRDRVWNLRLPRGLSELVLQIERATERLTDRFGRFPTPTELAEELGIPVEDVLEALDAQHSRNTRSLDAPVRRDGDSMPMIDSVSGFEPGFDRVEADLAAESADLDAREWKVLRMRFVEDLSQSEIGRRLNVSQMQISRISRGALWKLLHATRGTSASGPPPVLKSRAQAGANQAGITG